MVSSFRLISSFLFVTLTSGLLACSSESGVAAPETQSNETSGPAKCISVDRARYTKYEESQTLFRATLMICEGDTIWQRSDAGNDQFHEVTVNKILAGEVIGNELRQVDNGHCIKFKNPKPVVDVSLFHVYNGNEGYAMFSEALTTCKEVDE